MKERREKRELEERKRKMSKEKQESHGISIAVENFGCDNPDDSSNMSFSMIKTIKHSYS